MTVKKKPTMTRATVAKARKVLRLAEKRAKEVTNSMELCNALYTPNGIVSTTFPTEAERRAFAKTKEHDQLIKLIASMPSPPPSGEVIDVSWRYNGAAPRR